MHMTFVLLFQILDTVHVLSTIIKVQNKKGIYKIHINTEKKNTHKCQCTMFEYMWTCEMNFIVFYYVVFQYKFAGNYHSYKYISHSIFRHTQNTINLLLTQIPILFDEKFNDSKCAWSYF